MVNTATVGATLDIPSTFAAHQSVIIEQLIGDISLF